MRLKKLMRMKLINWHRFINETICFENSVLLSGENGAGKSTLLDALQFVITASKNHFNKAAHENGKRKLAGYVRCKTGKENKPYERTGEVTAHVALEFYEEEKKKYFILGAVIDSSSENNEKTFWYCLDGKCLEDSLFLKGKAIKNIEVFKQGHKFALSTTNSTEARKYIKNRFGRLEDKFFELIPKALAFKPIDHIKDFVYSYVLDEKTVNIDVLKDTVRSYQELEKMLILIKAKVQHLEEIVGIEEKLVVYDKKEELYNYYIARAHLEIILEQIQKVQCEIKNMAEEEQATFGEEARIKKQLDELNIDIRNLNIELIHDKDYIAVQELQNRIDQQKSKLNDLKKQEDILRKKIRQAAQKVRALLSYLKDEEIVQSFEEALSKYAEDKVALAFKPILEAYLVFQKNKAEELTGKLALDNNKLLSLNQDIEEIEKKIERLRKRQLTYDPSVLRLKQAITEQFKALQIEEEPRILCEILNITDERWVNAVEGYLNTQRFYLLVAPEHFDIAANVYEKLRKTQGIHSAGIINISKLYKYQTYAPESLASVVATESEGARLYINMILGRVRKCEKVEELKQYDTAITPTCMLYQNHVVRGINPKIYETPYIGKEAYKVQLQQAEQEQSLLKTEKDNLKKQIEKMKECKNNLSSEEETEILRLVHIPEQVQIEIKEWEEMKARKKELEKNNTYLQKQMLLEEKQKQYKEVEFQKDRCIRRQADLHAKIEGEQKTLSFREKEKIQAEQIVKETEEKLKGNLSMAQNEYLQLMRQKENLYKFKEDYEGTKKRNATARENTENELKNTMLRYKSTYDFGAEASRRGVILFHEELHKLKDSEMLHYESKVRRAKQEAEIEFKEQFLAKLQENIKNAQGEFKVLNKALEGIQFGQESYRFKYGESKRFSRYYRMIMDDLNMMEGFSLLSGVFNEKHKEVIDELFEKLTLDEENSSKTLEEFTDYRTYMDYDIQIDHGDGTHSLYSKVAEEKSGGETQTPFYVTVAASFVQLYTPRQGIDTIGLILFDEAFNNMDDERIAGVLSFLSKLPLQLIIAAPPDKIQYISPYMSSTLLVLKEDNMSYVEEYAYESL